MPSIWLLIAKIFIGAVIALLSMGRLRGSVLVVMSGGF